MGAGRLMEYGTRNGPGDVAEFWIEASVIVICSGEETLNGIDQPSLMLVVVSVSQAQ